MFETSHTLRDLEAYVISGKAGDQLLRARKA